MNYIVKIAIAFSVCSWLNQKSLCTLWPSVVLSVWPYTYTAFAFPHEMKIKWNKINAKHHLYLYLVELP